MKVGSFEEAIMRARVKRCVECNGVLRYVAGGMYKCQKCGKEQLDDFGRIKQFLDENGPTPAFIIHEETGIDMETINYMVKASRLECTEDSPVFFQCETCGSPIKSGRICNVCARQDSVKLRGYSMAVDVGDRPARMRYLGGENNPAFARRYSKEKVH